MQPGRALRPIVAGSRVVGIETETGKLESGFVIDAAGRGNWLARHLKFQHQTRFPRLIAHFAYMEGACPARDEIPASLSTRPVGPGRPASAPAFTTGRGSTWRTMPSTRISHPRNSPLSQVGRVQTADVTWRLVPQCAGDGYFLCGDAAAVLDPTSSHGVVKAIMSGAHAADMIVQITRGEITAPDAAAAFRQIFSTWFEHDVARLKQQHARWYGER